MNGDSSQKGFTLVELIIVIVIAGILAVGSVQFVGQATQGYSDAADRQQLATIGWIASEKVSRELRNALPNSVRIGDGGNCIEFVPIVSGSHYITLPGGATSDSFTAVTLGLGAVPTNVRVAVYPTDTDRVYAQSPVNLGPLSTTIVDTISTASNVDTITLNGDYTFLSSSPEKRFYLTQNPITYCITTATNRLNRYSEYGFNASFTIPANPQIIVDKVKSGSFSYSPSTLTRNGVVTMHFELEDGTPHIVDQEVQIRNVP